jgi:hypothetical protein
MREVEMDCLIQAREMQKIINNKPKSGIPNNMHVNKFPYKREINIYFNIKFC